MSTINKSQWYAIIIATITSFLIGYFLLKTIIEFFNDKVLFYIRKHLLYRRFHVYRRASSTTSWFQSLIICTFVLGNAVNLFLRANSRVDLMHQAGLLSIINLIPLGLGGHMNLVADSCGLDPESFNCMHRWIARVAVIEGLFHAILGITLGNTTWQHSTQIAAIVVSIIKA